MDPNEPFVDVVIIGAGISGIGAAYRIAERNPRLRYVILEQRARIGGTWDLFRYPGVRSDSSIFSLSFPWEPWTRREGVAEGADIRDYLAETAHRHGIDEHIRFGHRVRSADWDSGTDTWTVRAAVGDTEQTYRARFVFFGTGYYDYDAGHTPELPGSAEFGGTVVHPQHWPEDLDCAGKRVVVIGSGATAITLVPALARAGARVVMLQRSPTYVAAGARVSPTLQLIRKLLPAKVSHRIGRNKGVAYEGIVWFLARKSPQLMRRYLRARAIRALPPGYPVDVHFNPSYDPWDQRLCLDADGDLFASISAGGTEVVTDRIDRFDATGIWLESGRHLAADIVATATGLKLQALGGITVRVDGTEIDPADRFVYKAHLIEDVPNLAWCVGYTNASWTLRADITAQSTAKLLAHMDSHGYTHAYPHLGNRPMPEKPAWDINAGYVKRAMHTLPKSGTQRPWNVRQNYFADAIDNRFDRIDEDMVFGAAAASPTSPAQDQTVIA